MDNKGVNETYATLEQQGSHWLARILEPGKQPQYFVPDPHAYIVTKGDLVRAINRAHPSVVYVSEAKFNYLVEEASGRILRLPEDWPEARFKLGQEVAILASEGHASGEVTGIMREERHENGLPSVYVLMYRVSHHWYTADELSLDPPAEQVAQDDLFLLQDSNLP